MKRTENVSNFQYGWNLTQADVDIHLGKWRILSNKSGYETLLNTFPQPSMQPIPVEPSKWTLKDFLGAKGSVSIQGHLKGLCTGVRRMTDNILFKDEVRARTCRFAEDNRSVEKMVEKVIGLFE